MHLITINDMRTHARAHTRTHARAHTHARTTCARTRARIHTHSVALLWKKDRAVAQDIYLTGDNI